MDGGRMQHSRTWGISGGDGQSGSALETPSENRSSDQAHESVPETSNGTNGASHQDDIPSEQEVRGLVVIGGRENLPKNRSYPTREVVDSPSVADGLDFAERTSHQNGLHLEGGSEAPRELPGPSNQPPANGNTTEAVKVKYLKSIKAVWGDDFENDLAWPEPPGKSFLEDILRLIRNEKVTIDQFRQGVMPIFKERTEGKAVALTGWARYISRTDLKTFLKRKRMNNEKPVWPDPGFQNTFAPEASQRALVQNGERSHLAQNNDYPRQEIEVGDPTIDNPDSSSSTTAQNIDKTEGEQRNVESENTLDRLSNDVLQIPWDPRKGNTFIARDTSGAPLGRREVTGLQRTSDTPEQAASPASSVRPAQQDVNLERSTVASPNDPNPVTVYVKGKIVDDPPPPPPQPAQPTQPPQPQPQIPNSPRPTPLPKCFTCINVVSPRWYPYLTGPTIEESSTSHGNSGPRSIEYQCEQCHLQGRATDTVVASQHQGSASTSVPPKDKRESSDHHSPATRHHDGLPSLSEYALSNSGTRANRNIPAPMALKYPKPYAHAPAYLSIHNPHQVGMSEPGPTLNPIYQPPATAAPYQQPSHSTPRFQNSMTTPLQQENHKKNSSGHGFTPVNRNLEDLLNQSDSESRRPQGLEAHVATKQAEQLQQGTQPQDPTNTNATPSTTGGMSAKKRTMAAIIDLTDDSIVESIEGDDSHPNKRMKCKYDDARRGYAAVYGGQQSQAAQPANANATETTAAHPPHQLTSNHHHGQPLRQSPYFSTPQRNPAPSSSASSVAAAKGVRQIQDSLNDNPEIFNLREYDPKSIASDVLVAIGKHPHRPGLNDHLKHLKGKFGVDDFTDLSTFPLAEFGGRSLKPHNYNMPPSLGENGYLIQTPRANLARPPRDGHRPAPGGLGGISSSFTPHGPSSLRHARTPGSESSSGLATAINSYTPQGSRQPRHGDRMLVKGGEESREHYPSSSTPKKRGRPFTKNIPPGYVVPTPKVAPDSASSTSSKRGRPFSKFAPAYVSPTVPRPSSSGPKKRGRPFTKNFPPGYIPNPKAVPGDAPKLSKKRGRPFKDSSSERSVSPVERKFLSFLCEWKDCPADLHNLETLRAHIFVNHISGGPNGTIACLWADCNKNQGHGGVLEFNTKEEWQDHVNRAHLESFAWHMGDGPRGTSLDTPGYVSESSSRRSFLTDSNGREVTPSVKDQRIEDGQAKDNNEKRFKKKREGIHIVFEKIKSPKAVPAVVLERTRPLEGVPAFDGNEDSDREMTDELTATGPSSMADSGVKTKETEDQDEHEDEDEGPDEDMEE